MTHKYQYFDGVRFREETPGGYYTHSGTKYNTRMHRYVWEYYNGTIPDGYEVHHIDGDKSNNDISNLCLMTVHEHKKYHSENLSEEERERRRQNMCDNALPAACEWHKSEKGRDWHSKHAKQQHENGVFTKELVCTNCGKLYIGHLFKIDGNSFCSGVCKARYLRKKRSMDTSDARKCSICGKEFICSKWSKKNTCSKVCATKFSWMSRRNNESKTSD